MRALCLDVTSSFAHHTPTPTHAQFIESLVVQNTNLQRRANILRFMPDLVIVFDLKATPVVDFVSDACAEFLGVEGKGMKGRDVRDYLDSPR